MNAADHKDFLFIKSEVFFLEADMWYDVASEELYMKNRKLQLAGLLAAVIAAGTIVAYTSGIAGKAASLLRGGSEESMPDTEWILGNYNDASGSQGMFYTLKNNSDGTLIVIDGGWTENAAQVRQVIKDNGDHVTAWFITHTHNDHVGAFNEIFKDPQGITIDMVYDANVDYAEYKTLIPDWDTFDRYPEYESAIGDADNITHLSRDDEFMIDDLKVKVFNAYDSKTVKKGKDDIVNNSSLMLKFEGEKDSVLFCGDVHSGKMSKMLIKRYGEELEAEYVQPGHHGNNSLTESFYEVVKPQIAVFDATEHIMTAEEYSAAELKEYFESEGVEVYDYRTCPHFFAFE